MRFVAVGPGKKILVVGPSWVGDMVMAQSLSMDLKARDPACRIDVLAPSWSAALTGRMPEVDRLIDAPFRHGRLDFGKRVRLGRRLADTGYDQAIVLPNSLKSALTPAVAGIPRRTGYVGEQRWGWLNDVRRLDRRKLPMTIQRFVALGRERDRPAPARDEIPAPKLRFDSEAGAALLSRHGLKIDGAEILALCPGAEFGPAKRWPVDRYAELATHFIERNWRVMLLGGDNDTDICGQLTERIARPILNLAGKTSLTEVIDVLSQAALVVSNDSGLMHIAAALRRPLIALYGSSDPGMTPPLNRQARIVRLDLECSPCFKRECPLGHLDCLNKLTPAAAIDAAGELLAAG